MAEKTTDQNTAGKKEKTQGDKIVACVASGLKIGGFIAGLLIPVATVVVAVEWLRPSK